MKPTGSAPPGVWLPRTVALVAVGTVQVGLTGVLVVMSYGHVKLGTILSVPVKKFKL